MAVQLNIRMGIRDYIEIVEGRFINTAPEKAAEPSMTPKSQGWEAARAGEKSSANPHPQGSAEANQWDVGYQDYFFKE